MRQTVVTSTCHNHARSTGNNANHPNSTTS